MENKLQLDNSLDRRLNYVKLIFLSLDVGANVMLNAFKYLYTGDRPPEKHLVKLADVKSNNIYPVEKDTLQKLRDEEMSMNDLDISILYKLIQLTCGLESKLVKKNSVWSKNCPKEKRNSLEHFLFKYKEMRNKIIHDFRSLEYLTNVNFENSRMKTQKLLNSIIIEVGIKAELKENEIKDWQMQMNKGIEGICNWSTPSDTKITSAPPPPVGGAESSSVIEEEEWNGITGGLPDGAMALLSDSDSEGDGIPKLQNWSSFENKKKSQFGSDIQIQKQSFSDDIDFAEISSRKRLRNRIEAVKTTTSRKIISRKTISKRSSFSTSSVVLTKDILSRYGKGGQTSLTSNNESASGTLKKTDRSFWINRLTSSNVLDNENEMKTFMKEYFEA